MLKWFGPPTPNPDSVTEAYWPLRHPNLSPPPSGSCQPGIRPAGALVYIEPTHSGRTLLSCSLPHPPLKQERTAALSLLAHCPGGMGCLPRALAPPRGCYSLSSLSPEGSRADPPQREPIYWSPPRPREVTSGNSMNQYLPYRRLRLGRLAVKKDWWVGFKESGSAPSPLSCVSQVLLVTPLVNLYIEKYLHYDSYSSKFTDMK